MQRSIQNSKFRWSASPQPTPDGRRDLHSAVSRLAREGFDCVQVAAMCLGTPRLAQSAFRIARMFRLFDGALDARVAHLLLHIRQRLALLNQS